MYLKYPSNLSNLLPQTIPPFEFLNSPSGSPNLVTFLTQQGLVLGPAPPELPATAHRTAPRPPYQDPRGFGR